MTKEEHLFLLWKWLKVYKLVKTSHATHLLARSQIEELSRLYWARWVENE